MTNDHVPPDSSSGFFCKELTADYTDETDYTDKLNTIRAIRSIRVIRGSSFLSASTLLLTQRFRDKGDAGVIDFVSHCACGFFA